MANPQPDKYTKISNELMENIPKFKLNGSQLRMLLVVIRYTYGFNRKESPMSLTYLAKATGIHKSQIKRELDLMISQNIITVINKASCNTTRTIAFNKDYDEWDIPDRCTTGVVQYHRSSTVPQEEYSEYHGSSTEGVPQEEYQETKGINTTIKKDVKAKHGEYKNVTLTANEYQKLSIEYGEENRNKLIEFLSLYREEKGYKNKSDFLSIKRWVIKAVKEKGLLIKAFEIEKPKSKYQ